MTLLFDSHAHLTCGLLHSGLDNMLSRAWNNGVQQIVNICTDPAALEKGLALKDDYPWVYHAGATTPHDAAEQGDSCFSVFETAAKKGELVAVGETGLDYYYFKDTKRAQQNLLRRYLHLALDCSLPVIIHCRDAFADFFHILDTDYVCEGKHASGVLHCFSGTLDEAEQILDRGWYLSLSGIVTFKRSAELREVAKMTPLDRLLIETDSPYLAPQSKRRKQNEPAYLNETASLIAEIKGIDLQSLAKATAENARSFFRIASQTPS